MNTRERTQVRRLFVMAHLEIIEGFVKEDAKKALLGASKSFIHHPLRQWIESIRGRVGYNYNVQWRTIWFTLQKDYAAIKAGWQPQNLSVCDVFSYSVLYCYPCKVALNKGFLSLARVKIYNDRLPCMAISQS